ncbi:CBF1-interacting co-repressor CIR, N-terminal domain [Dillenia turbinata]|uniref:CBF1-interacting co-repressor CIR, N-terminal domain n=1 Tax=Dillenia turbinata TaxID=194707 RepID=A0AAN8UKK9_9MAGN
MEEEGTGGIPLGKKRATEKGEVDYKTKAGTAWSHSYLNQKPWHPLSYPNQRRKWIAEQTHAQRQRRAEEVSREFAQEQEFFRQTALISKKEKEKVETMKAVSFMYVRPPGYNPESAKAAELADEKKRLDPSDSSQHPLPAADVPSASSMSSQSVGRDERKKPRPKDVFGRPLPTEEEFEVLKNAPRLETGIPARVKPFGVEVRNVRCVRCGNYGHQSGDRECPLKDVIMPNEENRLKRDDPLTAILVHTDSTEPLKWELKQKPGISPPRGGFNPDDPNQQIIAEDIFDEYGGFLTGGTIPELLTNFSSSKPKKATSKNKIKQKKLVHSTELEVQQEDWSSSSEHEFRKSTRKEKRNGKKMKEQACPDRHTKRRPKSHYSSSSDHSDSDYHKKRCKRSHLRLPNNSEPDSYSHKGGQHVKTPYRQRRCHRSSPSV